MKMIRYAWVLILLSGLSFAARAQVAGDPEYRKMLDRLNRHYADFFKQSENNKRFENKRTRGAAAESAKRLREKEVYESARRKFVAQKKKPVDTTALEKAWEKKREQEAKAYDQRRRNFVRKQAEIEKVQKSARRIPEEVSSGLVPY